jgi:hypothetical protein
VSKLLSGAGSSTAGKSRIGKSSIALTCLVVIACALVAVGAHAAGGKAKRYGIEGKFVSYDQATQTFVIFVTSRKAGGFGGSTVGGEAPDDIAPRKERVFAVKPEGSVLSRTVIKSSKGTGLDNSGTQAGFNRAVSAIPEDRVLALSIEKNAAHESNSDAPEYRIKTMVLRMTEEELRARWEELLQDD